MVRLFMKIVLCTLTLFAPVGAAAKQDGCITSECHPAMGKAKQVHGPVAAFQCVVCHVVGPNDRPPKEHNLSYYKEGKALCLDCHETLAAFLNGKTSHGPIEEGECIICHDPHQSDAKFLLTEKTLTGLCFTCHENTMTTQKVVHKPVADGDCIVCHNPHASQNNYLLVSDRLTLCFTCHEDRKHDFQRKYVHDPAKDSCEYCHNPHGSPFAYHLKEGGSDLCAQCHEDFVEQFKKSDSKHTAVIKEGCPACHSPHSSDNDKGLRVSKEDLCLDCHEAMKKKIAESRYLHGPVVEGDCCACHDPHATTYAKHLVRYFPDEFYIPYKIDNYAMCFSCHNKEVATNEFTETLTDFRNGDKNLHFVHVNREKGRSCKACHEIHAGNQAKHIAQEVPYGKSSWMLPITYTKTETGGSCVVGCHKEHAYDREKPVPYDTEE